MNTPQRPKGLEIATVAFGSTSVGLASWIIADSLGAAMIHVVGAAGASFGVAFGIGMKVFEHLRAGS